MRTILAGTLFALLSATASVSASDNFRESFLRNISLDVTPKAESHVGHIIQAPVYTVRFEAFPDHSPSPSYAIVEVFEADDELVPVVVPSTNQVLPFFQQLITPDFRLGSSSAENFEAVLIAIMPDAFFEDDRGEVVEEGDGRWVFPTGEFFDRAKGFVVDLNESGQVIRVSYSLEL